MGQRDLVNKFTSGELDPRFIAEVDYDGYRKAAQKLRNVITIPQGGVIRRFGTDYEHTILDNLGNPVTNPDQVRLISYEYANDQLFYIVIRPDTVSLVAFDIYLEGVFQTTVNAPAATYTAPDIRNIRWIKDYSRLIILLPTVRPYELRIVAPNNWELLAIPFQWFPTEDFTSMDNPATLPTPNVPYTAPGVTFTPNAMAATTLTASTAVYTSNHVNGLFFGSSATNTGIFRITAVNGAGTVATGFCIEDFLDTSPIMGNLSFLGERAWNDGAAIGGAPVGINRGWPSLGTFYQSRLVLGGSPALPGFAYASGVKAYYDFDDSSSDASFTYGVEAGVTGNDRLTDILATKTLVLISNKGPSSTSVLLETPTTPTNAFMNTQGTEGSRFMNSVIIDNQIIYADRAGNTIWSMAYEVPDTGYNIANASILSTQLIRGPRWADIWDPDDIDGRFYMLVNSDGTLAVYHTIAAENIRAWTLQQTTGSFIDVASVANECKVLTRRKVVINFPTGDLNSLYTADPTFVAITDITGTANPVIYTMPGDYIFMGGEIQWTIMQFDFVTPAVVGEGLVIEFLTNTGEWAPLMGWIDTTNGFTANGQIFWPQTAVSAWKAQQLPGTTEIFGDLPFYYWLRISCTNPGPIPPVTLLSININTSDLIMMEECEFTDYMDCTTGVDTDANGLATGLTNLAGQSAFIFANGFPLQEYYIDVNGQVTIPSAPFAHLTVGLDYVVNITPMPVLAVFPNGISVYEPAHVKYVYIDFFESLGVTFQGQNLPQAVPGNFMTQVLPVPFTGYYKLPSYNGWDARAEFKISQSYPAPMTILAISYTLEVSP